MIQDIWVWIGQHPLLVLPAVLVIGYLLYRLTQFVFGRVSYWIVIRTETVYDDLMVDALHPFRFTWLVPLVLIYYYAKIVFGPDQWLTDFALFFIIVMIADLVISVLGGMNAIYKHRPEYSGVSVTAYFGIAKVLVLVVALVFIASTFTDIPPLMLLSGIGAWLAVLLLIFRDTILNFLASIQISAHGLFKEGDWIEVPSFEADGTAEEASLGRVKVRNFDNSVSYIPTHKIVEVPLKNWQGMQEMGARRIKRALTLDIHSVRFCDLALLEKLSQYDLIAAFAKDRIDEIRKHEQASAAPVDFPLDGPGITNVDVFVAFVIAYLAGRPDLHNRRLKSLVRVGEPNTNGLPVEVFAFTKTTVWAEYEHIQAEIFNYLLAALPHFDLQIASSASLAVSLNGMTSNAQPVEPD